MDTQNIQRNKYELDFYSYQLTGTDVFRDSLLTDRLVEGHELEEGMTVYATGLLGETIKILVTEVDGRTWRGESRECLISGEFQPHRYAQVASEDVSGWALTCMGSLKGLERCSFV
jgi:hypothetical protein